MSVSTQFGFSEPTRFPSVLGLSWPARPNITTASRVSSLCLPSLRGTAFPQPFQSRAVAVGQYIDPLSLVRRANFSRAEYAPRRSVTQFSQFAQDVAQPQGNVSLDVLKKTELWSEKLNAACDVGPKMSRVVGSEALPSCAEWLAWVTSSEDVHAVTKLCPWEGFKIRPNRCWVHESRFHFCNQVRASEGFDLTKSDCAQSWEDSLKSKLNASVSGTKADVCKLFGSIHI